MSEFVKSTNFTSKDSLATGNPLKIVKGAEFDTEFNNIVIAVATKADLLSPVLTGVPLAPTAAYGTNTTQLATTAFVTAALQLIYPVGSIYTNASVTTNPATLVGFGTWTAFGSGKVLVGLNGADASFDVLGETGGSKDSVVVSHSHAVNGSMSHEGSHSHNVLSTTGGNYSTGGNQGPNIAGPNNVIGMYTSTAPTHTHDWSGTVFPNGVSEINANLQPYVVVNMWLRTA